MMVKQFPLFRLLTSGLGPVLALALWAGAAAAAPGVTLQATVDRDTVAAGEGLTYTLTVQSQSGQTGQPQPPDFQGFLATSSGTSTSLNMSAGAFQLTMSTSYQLIAQKEGSYTFGPAQLEFGGETIKSNPVTVRVLPGGTAPPPPLPSNPPGAGAQPEEPAQPGRINPKKLFLFATVGKNEVMVGEPLSYYSALLSEYDLAECNLASEAQFTGFVVENLEVKRQLQSVNFKGKRYPLGCEVSKKILIPAAPGTFTIRPETLRAGVKVANAQRQRHRGGWPFGEPTPGDDPFEDPIFDRFFGRNFQVRPTQVSADPIQVTVLPLPSQGKPANFTGIIAEGLTISACLDRKVDHNKVLKGVKDSDALNYKVVLSGRGDMRALPKPELALGDAFKEYESKATPEVKVDESGISGKKTFEYVLVPRHSGHLEIPPVEIAYFDSSQRQYRTVKSEPIAIDVTPGEKEEALTVRGGPEKKDVAMLGRDIRYIVEGPEALLPYGVALHRSTWFRLLNLLPLAGFVVAVLHVRRRNMLARDPVRARRLAAARAAREAVSQTRERMAANTAKDSDALRAEPVRSQLRAGSGHGTRHRGDAASAGRPGACAVKKIATLLVLQLAFVVAAGGAQDAAIFAKANDAYKSRDYPAALEGYKNLSARIANPNLYLNLGNAAYKTDHLGLAILYYERGLRLQPRHPDLAANLEFLRERIVDKSGDEGSVLEALVAAVYRYLSLNELLVLTSVFWLLTLAVTAAVYWLDVPFSRCFSVLFSFLEAPARERAAALLLPSLFGLAFFGGWTGTRVYEESIPRAIVMEKEVKATSGPGADATVVFAIHEGTKLTVLRRSDRWIQISLANGYSGWVPEDTVQEI
ncbi:MAG: BatD family protein [Candidatus Wallbacteria bacterium]|nr:BatD family protein [Candidatus Wallbacteria bacterium]